MAPAGSLDVTFSGDGKQTTNFGRGPDTAFAVAVQDDGKIVAAGRASVGGGSFALARYDPDGSLDTSFHGDGRQTTDFGGDDAVFALAIHPDDGKPDAGKIVAAGQFVVGGVDRLALARYNPDGSLDTSFHGDGKQVNDSGHGGARAVALQSDGKILVVGTNEVPAGTAFMVARFNSDGSLDNSFANAGAQNTVFDGDDAAFAVAVQPGDDKIVAAGRSGTDFALARYHPDGSLDTTFAGDGKVTTSLDGDDGASAVAIQPDGKIVAAGWTGTRFGLARYNPDGSPDATFDGNGKLSTSFGPDAAASAVAIQPDGKIVAVGKSGSRLALARYRSNGSLDAKFSGDGKQTTEFGLTSVSQELDFGLTSGRNRGVALHVNGHIVVAVGENSAGSFTVARYRGWGFPVFATPVE